MTDATITIRLRRGADLAALLREIRALADVTDAEYLTIGGQPA